MKKITLSILGILTAISLTGCGEKNDIKLDLKEIDKNLSELTIDKISIPSIDYYSMEVFGDMEFVYDFDFENVLGLNSSLVEEYNVNYNSETKELLAVIRPVEGKKEEVKGQLVEFMSSVNAAFTEVEDILIYVSSKDNDKVVESVKNSKDYIFNNMREIDKSEIKDLLDIEESSVEEFLMKTPQMLTQSNTYIIAKPAKGKEKEVKNAIDTYMTKLEAQWEMYLVDQYELVKNRKVEKIGDYLVYIVSSDNNLVFNTINK